MEKTTELKTLRCACYTRKSTDIESDQQFNTLEAQREACESYIRSQSANGWVCLPDHYDDGGFSGGNTDRPGLQRLLADCEAGRVDIIVVYKIDRLTRSLSDFTNLQKFLDEHNVSFVSVTQSIDTSTSAGRMMLNILMSFGEFERDQIRERILDKMSAQKKKGMWCGGAMVYGYDLDHAEHKLVVNPEETKVVRFIFEEYLRTGSAVKVAIALRKRGFRGKEWVSAKGKRHFLTHVDRQNVLRMLRNNLYRGIVKYKGNEYAGQHKAIVSGELWNRVQKMLQERKRDNSVERRCESRPFGKLFLCGLCGGPMTVQRKCKNGREYRYYRCNEDNRRAEKTCREQRFPADELESLVLSQILKVLKTPTMLGRLDGRLDAEGLPIAQKISKKLAETWEVMYPGERNMLVHDILSKVVVYPDRIRIEFNMSGIEELLVDAGLEKAKAGEHAPYSYEVPCDLCKYGNVTKLAAPTVGEIQRNEVLVKAISTAYQYAEKLEHGKYQGSVIDLAYDLGKDKSDVRRTLKLVNLAPDIVQSIFNGDGPKKLSLADLMRAMPADWSEQRRMLGFPEAVG